MGGHGVGHKNVADTLARQRQRLRPGVAHHSVLVDSGHPRHLDVSVGNLTVGLVGNEVDRAAVGFAGTAQDVGNTLEHLAGIDGTRGVVGRVDDDRTRLGADAAGKVGEVGVHGVLARRRQHAGAAGVLDPHAVLGEEGGDDHDLVARLGKGADAGIECGGRTHGHVEHAGVVLSAEALVQAVRNGRARGDVALGRSVAVQLDGGRVEGLDERLLHLGGSRNGGVADGEVEHLVGTDLRLAGQAVGEQLTDCRTLGAQLIVRGIAALRHGNSFACRGALPLVRHTGVHRKPSRRSASEMRAIIVRLETTRVHSPLSDKKAPPTCIEGAGENLVAERRVLNRQRAYFVGWKSSPAVVARPARP